jgi:hypothetical protein
LKLLVHVSESELAVLELFQHLLVVLQLQSLDLLDKTLDIAHAEQFADERLRFKRLKVVDVLTSTDENNWTLCCGNTLKYNALIKFNSIL